MPKHVYNVSKIEETEGRFSSDDEHHGYMDVDVDGAGPNRAKVSFDTDLPRPDHSEVRMGRAICLRGPGRGRLACTPFEFISHRSRHQCSQCSQSCPGSPCAT